MNIWELNETVCENYNGNDVFSSRECRSTSGFPVDGPTQPYPPSRWVTISTCSLRGGPFPSAYLPIRRQRHHQQPHPSVCPLSSKQTLTTSAAGHNADIPVNPYQRGTYIMGMHGSPSEHPNPPLHSRRVRAKREPPQKSKPAAVPPLNWGKN